MSALPVDTFLLVRAGPRVCALALEQVLETMRPLSTAALPGTPGFVLGAAIIRGSPVPVVHLDACLGSGAVREPSRFVLVRCGERAAALAVDAVLGVRSLDASIGPTPLLDGGVTGAVAAVSAVDRELLVVLRAARIVPEDAWRALADREAAR